MVRTCFFFEIFQRVQCLRTFLNLIENNQRFPLQNLLSADHCKKLQNTLRILVRCKDGSQLILFIKVEIDEVLIAALPEFLHQPRFSNLSCTSQNERFSFCIVFPFYQLLHRVALHGIHRPFKG